MNENQNRTQSMPKTFTIIDGNTLMAQEYPPLQFSVEKKMKVKNRVRPNFA